MSELGNYLTEIFNKEPALKCELCSKEVKSLVIRITGDGFGRWVCSDCSKRIPR